MKKDMKTTEERYKILFESVKDIIVILDKKGRIVDINPAIKKLSGFNPKEIIGHYFQELEMLTPRSKKIIREYFKKRLKGIATAYYEIEAKSRNGKKLTAEVNAVPFVKNGNIVGSLAILRDITERKSIEEARQRFVEIATHQLRSPLASCRWTLDLFKSRFATDLEPEALEYLEQMDEHIEKLLSLAEDLLSTAKIESGLFLSDVKKIYLGKFLSRIIRANQALLNRKKITIKADFKKHSRILIESDLTKLDDIVDNLINNAIKYSRDGSEIQIGCRKFKKYLVIYIKDKGIGIPEKEKDKIFDRFFRASNAVKQGINGNGLGLFIAQRFTELLGGDLYFQSQQNKGSTFSLKLPLEVKSK